MITFKYNKYHLWLDEPARRAAAALHHVKRAANKGGR